jgi:hypothetical protein
MAQQLRRRGGLPGLVELGFVLILEEPRTSKDGFPLPRSCRTGSKPHLSANASWLRPAAFRKAATLLPNFLRSGVATPRNVRPCYLIGVYGMGSLTVCSTLAVAVTLGWWSKQSSASSWVLALAARTPADRRNA